MRKMPLLQLCDDYICIYKWILAFLTGLPASSCQFLWPGKQQSITSKYLLKLSPVALQEHLAVAWNLNYKGHFLWKCGLMFSNIPHSTCVFECLTHEIISLNIVVTARRKSWLFILPCIALGCSFLLFLKKVDYKLGVIKSCPCLRVGRHTQSSAVLMAR